MRFASLPYSRSLPATLLPACDHLNVGIQPFHLAWCFRSYNRSLREEGGTFLIRFASPICGRKKIQVHLRFVVLMLPVLMFIVSQLISICGAFAVLSSLDTDDIDDLSLEEIVSVDPFLHSQGSAKTVNLAVNSAFKPVLTALAFYVDELPGAHPHNLSIEEIANYTGPPPPNLWLSNRVLRI